MKHIKLLGQALHKAANDHSRRFQGWVGTSLGFRPLNMFVAHEAPNLISGPFHGSWMSRPEVQSC